MYASHYKMREISNANAGPDHVLQFERATGLLMPVKTGALYQCDIAANGRDRVRDPVEEKKEVTGRGYLQ